MTFKQTMAAIFNTAEGTYYKWKRENRLIITLLEKYFSQEDLEEYIKTNKISKFELLKEQELTQQYAANYYLNIFLQRIGSIGDTNHEVFADLYFNVLVNSKNSIQEQTVFKPFSIQKSALLYLSQNDIRHKDLEYEVIPKFAAGIELLDEFECYTNQFVLSCILQEFDPLVQVLKKDNRLDEKEKVEGYLHALLFHIYKHHTNRTREEKREFLAQIILYVYESLSKKYIPSEDPVINKTEMSLDILLRKDITLIEKEYENIIKAIEECQ